MTRVQVIEKDGKPAYYVVPAELWASVREAIEATEDAAAYAEAKAGNDGVRFPADVAYAIADGTHAVRAWREHRGLTLQAR